MNQNCHAYLPPSFPFRALATLAALLAQSLARTQAAPVVIPPDGPAQMAALYTHGFNDDGASWGLGNLDSDGPPIPWLSIVRDHHRGNTNTNIRLFAAYGMESYAVQWSAASPNVFSDPFATAASGFAFLADEAQLRRETDWIGGTRALHSRARPGFLEVLTTPGMNVLVPAYAPFEAALEGLWSPLAVPSLVRNAGRRTFYLGMTANVNNYNDSGRVDDHATDLLDLLRNEREPGGRLAAYRQVNILTHSKGSLVTRALLHKAEAASREDGEYVANVIYNAPPFAGSSLTELLKMMYDPPVFTRVELANPWLAQTFDEVRDGLTVNVDVSVRFGDVIRALLQTLGDPFRVDFSALESQVPIVKNNFDLLNVFTSGAFTLQQLANAAPGTAAATAGDLVAGIIHAIRPALTAAAGIPAFPTASVDLTPQGAVNFLQNYQNSSNAAQFVNIGTMAPAEHMLWPTDGIAAVAANPNLLTDPAEQQGQVSDTYVAVPSAQILTETDNFGPRYQLGGFYPIDHGGITLRFDLIATNWFSILLAPPTSLHLNGTVNTYSDPQRIFVVSTDSTFFFQSSNFSAIVQGQTLQVQPAYHQYRFLPRYASNAQPTPWETMNLGNSRSLSNALAAHGLSEQTVEIQWRAVNLHGGREMIRAATLVPVGDPPVVASTDVLGFSNEIVKRDRRRLRGGLARRSTFLETLPHRAADVAALRSAPEPDWTIRNQASKALVAVFDKVGSVDFAWNNPTLSSPTTRTNVNALFLTLESLTNGLHTLTFQPFNEVLGIERRGPVQTLRVFVDNTPPEHSFTGLEVDAIGWRVGPATVLQYRAEDLESGGAQGTVSVVGFSNTTFAAGSTFRLGDTDLVDQIHAAPGGDVLVGAFITFQTSATDPVGNLAATDFQAYFDFTAPTLTNLIAVGSLPAAPGVRVFTNRIVLKVDVREPNTSPYLPPVASFQNLQTGEASVGDAFGFEQTAGIYARFTNALTLFPGSNLVQVVCQDVYGNVSSAALLVDFAQPPASDTNALQLLTPRIDDVNSLYYDEAGNATNFIVGTISGVALSYDGRRFLFSSSGNGFVYGDNNNRSDVFLTEGGNITRVSTGTSGQQALGGHSDSAAISGNGRYAYFVSAATNLVAGTSNINLYVKDLTTGEIAVISRHFNGAPINRLSATFETAPTHNGRYVFFATQTAAYVNGLVDLNNANDVYLVDLDPDANGYFFDSNYVTVAISTATPTTTGSGLSRQPSVSGDGRYLLFLTQATNITPDLALNGTTRDALLMKFTGNANDGTLNVASRSMYVVNRASVGGGANILTNGVEDASLAPDGDTVIFASRSNVQFSGDNNSETTGLDIYSSFGERFGTASISNRVIGWQSRGTGGAQSSVPVNTLPVRIMIASDRRPAAFFNNKVAWVSVHTNLITGDANNVADVFVGNVSSPGLLPLNPPAPNWIASNLVSAAAVTDGGLTPDGRSAWWVTTQTYTSPYASGRAHLYVRRIDPPLTNTVTVNVTGSGQVTLDPVGVSVAGNVTTYVDTDLVTLTTAPAAGWRFTNWTGADNSTSSVTHVTLLSNRTVTATFVAAAPPSVNSLIKVLIEDTPTAPFTPVVTDADPGDTHTFSIVTAPRRGQLTLTPSGFVFQPGTNFVGNDSFTYQVTDQYGLMLASPGLVTLQVKPVNDPPQVQSLVTVALGPGQRGPIVPAVFDLDNGDTITFNILSQPANGSAVADVNGLYYSPNPGYVGADSFGFRATDTAGASDTGTVQINVLPQPVITEPGIGPAGFSLSVGALPPGVGYTVEYKDEMQNPQWLPVPPLDRWPSTEATFVDTLVRTQRFYRLQFEFLIP
jgi:hypothetical protein